jgi:hypothetical protein
MRPPHANIEGGKLGPPGVRNAAHSRWVLFGAVCLALLSIPYSVIAFNHPGEDIFITLRYARNLLGGSGLVFNPQWPDDRVEGFSNLLWLLLLAGAGKLGAPLETAAKMMSFASLALLILVSPYFRRVRTSAGPSLARHWLELFAPLALFFQPVLRYVSDFGLETVFESLLLFLVGAALLRKRYAAASLALVAVAMNRPEGFAYWFCFLPLVVWDAVRAARPVPTAALDDPEPVIRWHISERGGTAGKYPSAAPEPGNTSRGTLMVLAYALPWVLLTGSLFLWRLMYYGDWLPNTVHAKIPDWSPEYLRWQRLWDFTVSFSFLPVIIPLLVVLGSGSYVIRRHRREVLVAGIGVLSVGAFGLIVGGVAERFRHLAPCIPFFIVLGNLVVLATAASTARFPRRTAGALALLLLAANFYQYTNFDEPHTRLHARTIEFVRNPNWPTHVEWLFHEPVMLQADAGRWIAGETAPNAVVAADQVGQLAYLANRPIVDLLSLADKDLWHIFNNPQSIVMYLMSRGVTHVVAMVRHEPGAGPTEFSQPSPFLDALLRDPVFGRLYRQEALLRWRGKPMPWAFAVYERLPFDDGATSGAAVTTGTLSAGLMPPTGSGMPMMLPPPGMMMRPNMPPTAYAAMMAALRGDTVTSGPATPPRIIEVGLDPSELAKLTGRRDE